LGNLLQIFETQINELIRVKEKRQVLQISLKTLIQVLMKCKGPDSKKNDIAKNISISSNLLGILKNLLKIDFGKQYIEIISDIIKLIGLLARITFQKNFGI
jgi:hypothetical protein